MPRPAPALIDLAAGRRPDGLDGVTLPSVSEHRMQGLVWSWLRGREMEHPWHGALVRFDLATQAWHRRLWDTLATVRARLAGLSLEVATMKGVTTEARWYRRPGERPCLDLDLLLPPGAHGRADEILDALEPGHRLRSTIVDLVSNGAMQSVDVSLDGVRVDVHFDLFKLGIPTRQSALVWERTEPYPIPDGSVVRVPDAETALLGALLHVNKDGFPRLLGLADVARILASSDLDWAFVDRFVRAEGLEVPVYRSLATVTRLLCLRTVAARRPTWNVRSAIWSLVWRDRTLLGGGYGSAHVRRQDWIPFLARGRSAEAVRWLAQVVFPPSVVVERRYPDLRGPYLSRVARGKVRTARQRRARRRAPALPAASPTTTSEDPDVVARLFRAAVRNGALELRTTGVSMGWSIRDGSTVVVEDAPRPHRGEVWAFCDDAARVVVHRVRREDSSDIILQGDRSVRPDAPISADRLIGRVRDVRHDGRRQARIRWGRAAGAAQRVPRTLVATIVRTVRVATRPTA